MTRMCSIMKSAKVFVPGFSSPWYLEHFLSATPVSGPRPRITARPSSRGTTGPPEALTSIHDILAGDRSEIALLGALTLQCVYERLVSSDYEQKYRNKMVIPRWCLRLFTVCNVTTFVATSLYLTRLLKYNKSNTNRTGTCFRSALAVGQENTLV